MTSAPRLLGPGPLRHAFPAYRLLISGFALLVMGAAACGGDSKPATTASPTAQTAAAAPTSTSAPPAAAVAASPTAAPVAPTAPAPPPPTAPAAAPPPGPTAPPAAGAAFTVEENTYRQRAIAIASQANATFQQAIGNQTPSVFVTLAGNVQNTIFALQGLTPPPRFKAAHDEFIASHAAVRDHWQTAPQASTPALLAAWLQTNTTLLQRAAAARVALTTVMGFSTP